MRSAREFIKFESANSGLEFNEGVYTKRELASLLKSCLALANASVAGPRYPILGVHDVVGGERIVRGVDKQDLLRLKRRLLALIDESVEPKLALSIKATKINDNLVGIICLEKCKQQPYLLKKAYGNALPVGVGFVRRGTRNQPLSREDLKTLFESSSGTTKSVKRSVVPSKSSEADEELAPEVTKRPIASQPASGLRIGLTRDRLLPHMTLPVLPLTEMPSRRAAERIRSMLEAKRVSRDVLGDDATRFSRLAHARVYDAEAPYESHSDESLMERMQQTTEDYLNADAYYQFELRAHKLEIAIRNDSGRDLTDIAFELRLQRLEGVGAAEQVYGEDGPLTDIKGYPEVGGGPKVISIASRSPTLPNGYTARAFREPPRIWLREAAAGRSLAPDYSLQAAELSQAIRGTLVLMIKPPTG